MLSKTIDLSSYGTGMNSVAVKGDYVAAAVERKIAAAANVHDRGQAVIVDLEGQVLSADDFVALGLTAAHKIKVLNLPSIGLKNITIHGTFEF